MIIDFHTHVFPEKIAKRAIEVLENNLLKVSGEEEKAVLDGTLDGLVDSMQKNDITYSVVMPIATNPAQTKSINSYACEINGKNGVFSFGSVHPDDDEALLHLEEIKKSGLLGIKLHPEYQNFYIDSKRGIEILKKAEELDLYVMLHTGEDKGTFPPVHCLPKNLKNALEYVSGDRIIAAHMGGYNVWEDVINHLCGTNIYFDTGFSVGIMDDEIAKEIIKKHTADKILFATDSPWLCQGWVKDRIKNLGLSKEEEQKIFYDNGAKILCL